jgi:hypothetical protein
MASLVLCILSLLSVAVLATEYTKLIVYDVPQLSITILPVPGNITTDQVSTLIATVTCEGKPVSGTSLTLSCDGGSLNGTSGTTDSSGRFEASFSSDTPGMFVISAEASRLGYASGSGNATVTSSPSTGARTVIGGAVCPGCKTGTVGNRTTVLDDGSMPVECQKCPFCDSCSPLFSVYGALTSPYLRTSVGEIYEPGTWSSGVSKGESYTGGSVYVPPSGSQVQDFIVVPICQIGGCIPVMRETCEIGFGHELTRFPSAMSFYLDGTTSDPYTVTYFPEIHDTTGLHVAKCPVDTRMLQLPSSLPDRIRQLAATICSGVSGDYQRADAIRDFLTKNYVYDKNFTRAPEGQDPIDWFLFEEKRGVCTHFNSAFVILCRCMGITSRVVHGYLAKTGVLNQTVASCEGHCWAEVEFEGIGWVTFDATGLGGTAGPSPSNDSQQAQRVKTVTRITSQPSTALRGDNFSICGTVRTVDGANVSGVRVFIYIVKDKESSGIILGTADVMNGVFEVPCRILSTQAIGDFLIIAKTTESEHYANSTSDPPIIVMCKTVLSAVCPKVVSVGEAFNVSGVLSESETSLSIPNASLDIRIDGMNPAAGKTDSQGSYWSSIAMGSPANYTVCVSYSGDRLRLPCQAIVEVMVVRVRLDWTPSTDMVRNLRWNTRGRAIKGDTGVSDIMVRLEFDGIAVQSNKTDPFGSFVLDYDVPGDAPLGPHDACIALPDYDVTVHDSVCVFATTKMATVFPEAVEAGRWFLLNVSLSDDLDLPISGHALSIDVSSVLGMEHLERRTNEEGCLSVNITVPQDERVNTVDIKIESQPFGYYLGSQANGSVNVLHASTLSPLLLPGLGGIVLVLSAGGYLLMRSRTRAVGQQGDEREPEQFQVPPPIVEPAERPEIYFVFPTIREPFPLVWGVGDPLAVDVTCVGPIPKGSVLDVTVNGKALVSKECDKNHSFTLDSPEKGSLSLVAKIVREAEAISQKETTVRIVRYDEEISSMHHILMTDLRGIGITLADTLTLREEMTSILTGLHGVGAEQLGGLYSALEKVDYSLNPVSRRNYETAYLAQRSIRDSTSSRR